MSLGLALKARPERGEGVDLGLGERVGRRHLIAAVAALRQLDIHARRFGRHCGELDEAFRRGELAVLQLQPLRLHHPEQLLDIPYKTPLIS